MTLNNTGKAAAGLLGAAGLALILTACERPAGEGGPAPSTPRSQDVAPGEPESPPLPEETGEEERDPGPLSLDEPAPEPVRRPSGRGRFADAFFIGHWAPASHLCGAGYTVLSPEGVNLGGRGWCELRDAEVGRNEASLDVTCSGTEEVWSITRDDDAITVTAPGRDPVRLERCPPSLSDVLD